MRIFLILLATLFITLPFGVSAKEFTRNYTYRAGDDDSKNSARVKAIEQAKLMLLEEIGVYIQSYIEIDKRDSTSGAFAFLTHEIRTTTAGVTKTEVLTEKWNGKEYKLKVQISVDVEDVIKKINDTLEERGSSQNVSKLNKLIEEKNIEISELSSSGYEKRRVEKQANKNIPADK